MIALEQANRVISICLTVTTSLLQKLSAIERPFSELQTLDLLSRDGESLTLPNNFRWGPRLRRLHSTGIAFPSLLQLLHHSINLIDLRLHDDLDPLYFSPEPLTNALSGMTQLRSLSLHFLSTTYCASPLLYEGRVVLPALTCLEFRGNAEYLENLVTRIDAPRLEDIEITFFDHPILSVSMLSKFISRIEMHKSHRQAHIIFLEHAISISLVQQGSPTHLTLRLICQLLDKQILSLTRFCLSFYSVIVNVGELRISALRRLERRDDRFRSQASQQCLQQWLELLGTFTGVKALHLKGIIADDFISIMHILQLGERQRRNALPALHKLCIQQPGPRHAPLREVVVVFMVTCRLSGHLIAVEYEQQCSISEQREAGILPYMHPPQKSLTSE